MKLSKEHDLVSLLEDLKEAASNYRGSLTTLTWQYEYCRPELKRKHLMFKTMELCIADELAIHREKNK